MHERRALRLALYRVSTTATQKPIDTDRVKKRKQIPDSFEQVPTNKEQPTLNLEEKKRTKILVVPNTYSDQSFMDSISSSSTEIHLTRTCDDQKDDEFVLSPINLFL